MYYTFILEVTYGISQMQSVWDRFENFVVIGESSTSIIINIIIIIIIIQQCIAMSLVTVHACTVRFSSIYSNNGVYYI